ncbi:hypothetical protein JCGZ_05606 [Jatropha curcas]|uniref:Uncharacterized protein n=1 Tax=Jatropha curcas TaxID=180498 RepID=A0A067LIR2_JATCU|nr:hypothetical protein JCGZ_05606 [Jatropha curcas]
MGLIESKSTERHQQKIPPKRGQIKIKIVKNFIRSASGIASNGKMSKENGDFAISSPTTPATPTGYNSDAATEY